MRSPCCLHKSLPSVRVSMCISPTVARQQLVRHVPMATNTCNNRRTVGGAVFYTVHAISKDSLWVCVCIPLSLPGIGLLNTFPQQQIIAGSVIFYAVCIVLQKSRQLISSYQNFLFCTILYELFSFPPPFPPQHMFNI
jgi:hypothetical protein